MDKSGYTAAAQRLVTRH